MDNTRPRYDDARHCAETIKVFLLEIARSKAARQSPVLADRASLIRERFQSLCNDIDELWQEYSRR